MGEGTGCYSQSGAHMPQDQSGHQPALPPGSLYQLGRKHLARRRPPRGEKSMPTLHAGPSILTLYSVDTPLSVSRSELHGNCPVTLYKFAEKLEGNGTEL